MTNLKPINKPTNTTDPMEEAYKQLDGAPSMTAVSDAARGKQPTNQYQQAEIDNQEKENNLDGSNPPESAQEDSIGYSGAEVEQAYAQLFESLATILKSRV